jgi:Domain of unknown function (DUF5667)
MRLPEDPGFPVLPPARPTRDLLLAQALDACITAERRLPGSSQEIIDRQPAWARADLQRLTGLAGSLDAAASNAVMSSEFRVAARARLLQRIGGDAQVHELPAPLAVAQLSAVSSGADQRVSRRHKTVWGVRASAGLLAAVLAVTATLTASASALPGEPLYSLKQAQEELGVRLAVDDQERAAALLREADERLKETARLLQLGRTLDASATTLRYDQVVQRATISYVGTIDDTPEVAPATAHMEASLTQDQDQLQAMLQSAPEPARADLREALVATERGRALVADRRPVERALGQRNPIESAVAAVAPTMAAEDSPTVAATEPADSPTALPTRRASLVPPTPTTAVVVADAQDADVASPRVAQAGNVDVGGGGDEAGPPRAQKTTEITGDNAGRGISGRGSGPQPARSNTTEEQGNGVNNQPADDGAPASPPVLAHDDGSDTNTGGAIAAPGGGDDRARAVARTDLAQINGRAVSGHGGAADTAATTESGGQTDSRARGGDTPPPAVARQTGGQAASNETGGHTTVAGTGGKSNGGGGGVGGATHSVSAPVVSTPEHVNGSANAHAPSTTQATGPKPQPTPTPPSRHPSAGDANKGDGPQKPNAPPASAAHTGTDNHPGDDGK